MTYQRRTVWESASPLTAADLNAEFDAIAAAIQGIVAPPGGDPDTTGSLALVVNAGDVAFNPSGTASFATRVAEAIAFAATVNRKVVWVPKFMWGYAENAEWSDTMFDPSVLVVREGQLFPGYDPVAYGAKVGDVAVDNTPVFDVCFDHASTGTGPGAKVVTVTFPGAYQLDTAVTRPASVALWELPGVSYTGNSISVHPKTTADIPRPLLVIAESAFNAETLADSTELHLFGLTDPGAGWEAISYEVRFTEDAGAFSEWVRNQSVGPISGEPTFPVGDAIEVKHIDLQRTFLAVTVKNNDNANPHDIDLELRVTWVKVS